MQIDIFTVCDIAEIIQGKVILSGTFHDVFCPSFPSKNDFSVVVSLSLDDEEIGKEHKVGIKCLSPSGEELFDNSNTFNTIARYLNIVVNARQVNLSIQGNYKISLLFDGKKIRTYSFSAKITQQPV